ncbi:unnamed protein product [Closterium sp. Naga37s-1]|nr:unnamed protein product [Closterium sp. Naga37s-1]
MLNSLQVAAAPPAIPTSVPLPSPLEIIVSNTFRDTTCCLGWYGWMAVEVLENLPQKWDDLEDRSTWSRGEDCHSMDAVRCDDDGHVIAISTASHGTLKASIPNELGNLQQLTRLSVHLGGGGGGDAAGGGVGVGGWVCQFQDERMRGGMRKDGAR